MQTEIAVGDVLESSADVLISTANPWLNMSGGVNGAIRQRCPEIQEELHAHLKRLDAAAVEPGTAVLTSAGSLPFRHIIHAVAIDPFYDSSRKLVRRALESAFELACSVQAQTVALPTLATGYGPMSIAEFGLAFSNCDFEKYDMQRAAIIVRSEENAATLRRVLSSDGADDE